MSLSQPPIIKVLFIAAEADPLIKIGGLGDYAGSLPLALRNLQPQSINGYKLDVRLVIPFHGIIPAKLWGIKFLTSFSISKNTQDLLVKVYTTKINELPVYLISGSRRENKKTSIYSGKAKQNSQKYAKFSIACLEMLRHLSWKADILHANDWHTAFAILKLKQSLGADPFYRGMKSLLTIHNLAYMGQGSEKVLQNFRLQPVKDPALPQWAETQPLPMGLALADEIVTVSPTYAKEITTPEFGYGLEKLFIARKNSTIGILNGIDYQKWDPEIDRCIDQNYSFEKISLRIKNKQSLQKQFNLAFEDAKIPLLTVISRLDLQKGIDILIDGLRHVTEIPWQFIILGTGNREIEESCKKLAKDLPTRVRALICYDDKIARRLYTGADIILIPSRYEPCGTSQMIAMRYGCIPLARATGGLKDSINDEQDGFLFGAPTSNSFQSALKKAINIFSKQPQKWAEMQANAMKANFSWNNSALTYTRQYLKLLGL